MNNSALLSWDCWNQQQVQLVEAFQQYGCSLVSCYPQGEQGGFVHTVGLEYSNEHPELLSVDLPKNQGKHLVDALAFMVKGGRRFQEGEVCEPVAGLGKVRFAAAEPQDLHHLYAAAWFYHYNSFRALKVFAA